MKKKISDETKVKLIYSGELLIFALVFAAIAVLKILKVIPHNPTRTTVFNYITLAGCAWGLTDFIWTMVSKKKRAKACLLDKFTLLPLILFMITYDLISLIAKPENENFYVYMLSGALFYVAVIYIFQGIYHYFRPLESLMEELEKDKAEEAKKLAEAQKEDEEKGEN